MFKKIGEWIFIAVVLAITAFGAVHIVTGCGSLPVGQRAVITEKANVQPEAFKPDATGQAHAFPAPVETLGGTIGNVVKSKFVGKEAILTTEDHLVAAPVPGSTILILDASSIDSLLNPATQDIVTQLAAKVVPAAAAPWVGPLACFLPLLIPNFRKNATIAVQRVVPGVPSPDPKDTGKLPDIHDFRQAISDLAQAITLQKPDTQNYARPNTAPMTVPING